MSRSRLIQTLAIMTILAIAISFIPLPYYISTPGKATVLAPMVEVEGTQDNQEGSFMLTTVRMGPANPFNYLFAQFQNYTNIYPEEQIRRDDQTDEEYEFYQLNLMEGSQEAAIQVAYENAGKPFEVEYNGIYVVSVVEGMGAEGVLEVADRIVKIDGNSFASSQEFIDYVEGMQAGDTIEVEFQRDGKTLTDTLELQTFENNPGKVGLGISLVDDKEIDPDPDVTILSEDIGGPSAGLMFSLQIYDMLTEGDLTKGYAIAGTGEIAVNGKVGPIGGIGQKIVAADNAKAEIFLAPNEEGAADSNYSVAVETAKDIGTDMKVVPVDTFEDALEFLQSLEERS